MLFGGSAVLLVSGLYAFTYQPIIEEQQQLDTAIGNQERLQDLLQSISHQATNLRTQSPLPQAVSTDQSLLSLIDGSGEQAGIKPAIKRLQPEGQDSVAISLEHCPFDQLITWLVTLNTSYGINVQQISISKDGGDVGKVKGKVLLGR